MSEANKAIARRLVEEVWNKGNLAVADEILALNVQDWDAARINYPDSPGSDLGAEGFKQLVTLFRTAFPDVYLIVEDMVAEGDKVVVRWIAHGTHKGELRGIGPTGKQMTVTGIDIHRIAGGKIVEGWGNWDTMGMMQQLGVIPEVW